MSADGEPKKDLEPQAEQPAAASSATTKEEVPSASAAAPPEENETPAPTPSKDLLDVSERSSVNAAKNKLTSSMNNMKGGAAKLTSSVTSGAVDGAKQLKKLVSFGDNEQSWEELVQIEKRRRKILKQHDLPMHEMLLRWHGTVLSALTKDPMFYLMFFIYIAIRIASRYSIPEFVATLGGAPVGIVGGFLSFFLIFYVNTSYKRFDTLYQTSMGCEGRIFDAAALAKANLPRANALRLIRYMNAVHIAGYVGLSDTYNYLNFFSPNNAKTLFLTPKELERILRIDMNAGGSAYRELTTWCTAEVTTAVKEGLIDNRLATQFRELILKLRGKLGALYDYDDQPISFYYVHFICLLSAIYLPLFSLQVALDAGTGDAVYWLQDVLSGLTVLLQGVFFIGLRVLASKLSDPYGDDVEDLSVMHYVNFTWRMSMRMLEAELPEPLDPEEEEELCKQQTGIDGYSIGEAWRPKKVEGSESC